MDKELAEVVGNEVSLLRPDIRSRREAVLGFLHGDFRGFGASGRVWDREQLVAELAGNPGPGAEAEDVAAVAPPAGRADRQRLLFHQGTRCPE